MLFIERKMIKNKKLQISNLKSQISKAGAFTLLEVIVSLAIITMLITIFLTNYNAGSRNNDLTFAAQKMISDIRLAQNNALGLAAYGGSLPPGGWGIHLSASQNTAYLLFADANAVPNHIYDSGEAVTASGGRTFTLPANLIIDYLESGGSSRTALDITFLPPDPSTMIYYGAFSSSTNAVIRLKDTVTGKTKNVNVNILGLIEAN
jgi:type II secretory pathway pseudopilin PulG